MSALPLAYGGKALMQVYMANAQADLTLKQNGINQIIAQMNAENAELEAYKALQQGYTQTARYQAVIDKTVGSQATIQAATSDIDTSQGTAADVREETRLTGYLNTLDIMQQARAKSKQLKMEASSIRLNSDMGSIQAGMNAVGQRMGGMMDAVATGVTGYSNVASPSVAEKPGSSSGASLGGTGYMGLAQVPMGGMA